MRGGLPRHRLCTPLRRGRARCLVHLGSPPRTRRVRRGSPPLRSVLGLGGHSRCRDHKGDPGDGDSELVDRWRALEADSLRGRFADLRDLPQRVEDVAAWRADVRGSHVMSFGALGTDERAEVIGLSGDYLRWIRDVGAPPPARCDRSARPRRTLVDPDVPLSDHMPFPRVAPGRQRTTPSSGCCSVST